MAAWSSRQPGGGRTHHARKKGCSGPQLSATPGTLAVCRSDEALPAMLRHCAGCFRGWLLSLRLNASHSRKSSRQTRRLQPGRSRPARSARGSPLETTGTAVEIPWRNDSVPFGTKAQPVHVYFPTDDRTGRAVLVHGDFYVDSARRHIEQVGPGGRISDTVAEAAADLLARLAASVATPNSGVLDCLAVAELRAGVSQQTPRSLVPAQQHARDSVIRQEHARGGALASHSLWRRPEDRLGRTIRRMRTIRRHRAVCVPQGCSVEPAAGRHRPRPDATRRQGLRHAPARGPAALLGAVRRRDGRTARRSAAGVAPAAARGVAGPGGRRRRVRDGHAGAAVAGCRPGRPGVASQ